MRLRCVSGMQDQSITYVPNGTSCSTYRFPTVGVCCLQGCSLFHECCKELDIAFSHCMMHGLLVIGILDVDGRIFVCYES